MIKLYIYIYKSSVLFNFLHSFRVYMSMWLVLSVNSFAGIHSPLPPVGPVDVLESVGFPASLSTHHWTLHSLWFTISKGLLCTPILHKPIIGGPCKISHEKKKVAVIRKVPRSSKVFQ